MPADGGKKRPITQDEIVDIKIYGRQWYWNYIYGAGDTAIDFDSHMIEDACVGRCVFQGHEDPAVHYDIQLANVWNNSQPFSAPTEPGKSCNSRRPS